MLDSKIIDIPIITAHSKPRMLTELKFVYTIGNFGDTKKQIIYAMTME